MFRISCFTDEISPDLQVQIDFLVKNNLKYMELRSVWDKNVLDLTDAELSEIGERLSKNNIKISSIASPIGKVDISEDFDEYLKVFDRAIKIALKMDVKYIRVFSFYDSAGNHVSTRDEVLRRLNIFSDIAASNNLVLVHENEADIFGESSHRCEEICHVNSPNLRAAFDFSNFVVANEDVLNTSFPKLDKYIEYIHVKDSRVDTGAIVIAGQGDGRIAEILDKLRDRVDMFVSLEPHLVVAGQFKGFSGEALFQQDLDAFIAILDRLDIDHV